MNRLIILVGKEEDKESYQLLQGRNYTSFIYSKDDENHDKFIKEVSEEFATEIVNERVSSEVGILNGYRIDEDSHKLTKINRLETGLFERMLCNRVRELDKLNKGKAEAIMATAIIN